MSKWSREGPANIKFPINDRTSGRRKSQIEEYLDYNHGPGVQHIACATDDIVSPVSELRGRGVEFLRVSRTYCEDLESRVGTLSESIDTLAELGILADRDEEGYL